MRKLEYQVLLQDLTQFLTSFVIDKSKLQENQKWCKIALSFTWLTNNLAPCDKKFVVKNVINLMVSSSTSNFTIFVSSNYKIVWKEQSTIILVTSSLEVAIEQTKQMEKSGELEWWTILCIGVISDESFGVHSQVMNVLEQGAMCSNREFTRKMEKTSMVFLHRGKKY